MIPVDLIFSYIRLQDPISAVLVVEKEAVYRQLCSSPLFNPSIPTFDNSSLTQSIFSKPGSTQRSNEYGYGNNDAEATQQDTPMGYPANNLTKPGSVLIVTGKGFPDSACRQFLSCLSTCYPTLPFYALVDSDPYGIAIFLNYKYSTKKQISYGAGYCVSKIEYLGVSLNDYRKGRVTEGYGKEDGFDSIFTSSQGSQSFLGSLDFHEFSDPINTWTQMSSNDLKKSFTLLQEPYIMLPESKNVLRELQMGMFLGKKAEMNNAISVQPSNKNPHSYLNECSNESLDNFNDDSSQTTLVETDTQSVVNYSYYKLNRALAARRR